MEAKYICKKIHGKYGIICKDPVLCDYKLPVEPGLNLCMNDEYLSILRSKTPKGI